MGTFLRQKYKEKPQAFGPVSAVQRSLFINAEAMGIPAPDIYLPLWEKIGSTAKNYGKLPQDGTLTNAYFSNQGCMIGDSESRISLNTTGLNKTSGTIFIGVVPNWNYNTNKTHYLFDSYGGGNKRFFTYKSITTPWASFIYTDGVSRGSSIIPFSNKKPESIFINYGVNEFYFRNLLVADFSDGDLGLFASNLYIGDRYSLADAAFDGEINQFIWFNSVINANSRNLLSDNPYQLLQPVPMRSYFIPSGEPTGGTLNFSGVISSLAMVLGEIKKTARLDGSATGTAGITGQMSVAKTLSGEITGQTDISGMLSVSRSLSGSIGATADVQGEITLAGIIRLSGSIGSVADVVGALALKRTLSGTANSTAGIDGQISAIRRLSGMVDAKADIQGSVSIFADNRISLSGNIGAMAAIEGAINVKRGVTGQVQAYADINGQTSIKLNLRGSVDVIADIVGTLRVIGEGSLGVVIDPVLTSLTKKLILTSITKKYFINSI